MKNKTNTAPAKSQGSWRILAVTLFAAVVINMLPQASFADSGPFDKVLCDIAGWFTGSTGKAVATIAVIFLGIAAFFGKVTWGLALMFAVGIFAIFGASTIVNTIAEGNDKTGDSCLGSGGGK